MPLPLEEEEEEGEREAALTLFMFYYISNPSQLKRRRKELEEECAVRCQRGARYFLVTRMMKRQLHAHKVIKRSFRRYFFRVYKKQLRRIMNCWRSYWLRHHLKLIQRVYRGLLGKRKARVTRLKVVAAEAVRGARELEAVNNMLLVVDEEVSRSRKKRPSAGRRVRGP